jgi:hypothetical protein
MSYQGKPENYPQFMRDLAEWLETCDNPDRLERMQIAVHDLLDKWSDVQLEEINELYPEEEEDDEEE